MSIKKMTKDELELFRIDNGEKVYLYQNFKDFNKVFLQKNIEKIKCLNMMTARIFILINFNIL